MTEPLYHLISDAHKGVLHPNDPYEPVAIIDEMIERLTAARSAYLTGDTVAASGHFDPRYVVKSEGSTVAGVASDGSLVVIAETRRIDISAKGVS